MLWEHLHIPSTFDSDSYVSNVIETAIGESLTQTHSSIKKTVRRSLHIIP